VSAYIYSLSLWRQLKLFTGIAQAVLSNYAYRTGDEKAAFCNNMYHTVAGLSEYDTFRSNQIREGMITRDEALRSVAKENWPRYPTIKRCLDPINVEFEHAIATMNRIPKLYA